MVHLESMMDRRRLILSSIILCYGSGEAAAQASGKVWRVGFLSPRKIGNLDDDFFGAFPRTMRELGYVEGKNLIIEWRSAEGRPERLAELADELVRLKVDVLVCAAVQGVRAGQAATATIPIVMGSAGDPVAEGFIQSLAKPGGNITGTSTNPVEVAGKRLALLLEIRPKLKRVAVLWNPTRGTRLTFETVEAVAKQLGIKLLSKEATNVQEIEDAFVSMKQDKAEALYIIQDALFTPYLRLITELALKQKLPSVAAIREFVESGGLLSYGPSFIDNYRQAAVYVDKILKGAKPADLPVAQPLKYDMYVNEKTARTLGLVIPRSMVLTAEMISK